MTYKYDPDAILADPDAHPTHKMYAAINKDVRDNGTPWAKCADCGDPYVVSAEGSTMFCSDACEAAYGDYLGGL